LISNQLSQSISKIIDEMSKVNKSNNAYIAGCLDSWAVIIEENPEMTKTIIKDMQELAAILKKSAGVVMSNAD